MMSNMTGHEHNRRVAWVRLWGAVAAQAVVDARVFTGVQAEIARDLARFEARRYAAACYALGTTTAALAAQE